MLPYLLTYTDPKLEQAYQRYLAGESQRKLAKDLGISERTLARRSKEDGWEDERRTRRASAEGAVADVVAAVAAEPVESAAIVAAELAAAPQEQAQPTEQKAPRPLPYGADEAPLTADQRIRSMDAMLRRQQRFADRLARAMDTETERIVAEAERSGRTLRLSQISQLAVLGERVLSMQRRAYCVPDKFEIKDTTPAADKHIDTVRRLREEREAAARAAEQTPAAAAHVM